MPMFPYIASYTYVGILSPLNSAKHYWHNVCVEDKVREEREEQHQLPPNKTIFQAAKILAGRWLFCGCGKKITVIYMPWSIFMYVPFFILLLSISLFAYYIHSYLFIYLFVNFVARELIVNVVNRLLMHSVAPQISEHHLHDENYICKQMLREILSKLSQLIAIVCAITAFGNVLSLVGSAIQQRTVKSFQSNVQEST